MSVDYKILLMCSESEDQAGIQRQLMDYFRIHEPGKENYVVFAPIANEGYFCDYVKDLDLFAFVDYVKAINWRNDQGLFLAVSSNGDPFEVCISQPAGHAFDAGEKPHANNDSLETNSSRPGYWMQNHPDSNGWISRSGSKDYD